MKEFFSNLWQKIKPKKKVRWVNINGKKVKVPRDNQTVLTKRKGVEKVIFGTVCVFFSIYAIMLLYPLFYLAVNSLEDSVVYALKEGSEKFGLPEQLHFSNYVKVFTQLQFEDSTFMSMLFNTLFYTFIPTAYGLFWPTLNGYVFAKYNFKIKGVLYAIAITCMTLPIMGTGGAAFKLRLDLGMYDNRWAFLIGGTGSFDSRWLILLGIFKGIPWSYAEAVFMDGGNDFIAFFKVMLPMAVGPIVTLSIIASISCWNDYTSIILFMPSYQTVASGLYFVQLTMFEKFPTIYYAALFISMIPVIVVFAIFSEQIMKNMSVGGLKG